jgi:hypothetical protein
MVNADARYFRRVAKQVERFEDVASVQGRAQ